MKWAALAVALASIVPLAGWFRTNPRQTPKVWMLIGFLPFVIGTFHLYTAIISWAGWPGYVKGAEVSVVDILALALYLSLPRTAGRAIPFRLSMVMYLLAVLLSATQASVPTAALFYAWQLARMFLVYAVVIKACADERVMPALLSGMTIGLCFEACDAIWERYGLGILQAGGTMGHQNFLGLMSHFATFPWIALLLEGERGWFPFVGPLAGLIVAVLTVSRATIGLGGLGYLGMFILSGLRRWTHRKAVLLATVVAVACVLVPVALISFKQRFTEAPIGDYDERAAFMNAAAMMVSDHPLGIGANNYVVVANTDGYNSRAGVAFVGASDSANVHNIYYLVTAETGYIGLLTFVLVLFRPLLVAFRCGWQNRRDPRGDLLLGLGMSLLMVYIHSYFEWVFITYPAQYMFALDAGMIVGIADNLGYWQRSSANNRLDVNGMVGPIKRMARN